MMRGRRAVVLGVVALALSLPAFAGASSSTPTVQPPGLDHFLCYGGKALKTDPFEKVPKKVTLVDQLGQTEVKLEKFPTRLCNPATKILPTGDSFIAQNPNAHLVCWRIKGPTFSPRDVVVTNQFGSARLTVTQPDTLCLPSWKSPTDDLPPADAPTGLDHFTCYKAQYSVNQDFHFESIPKRVTFIDQFQSFQTKVKVPVGLCVPVNKILKGGPEFPPQNPDAHLVCFQILKSSNPQTFNVFVKNQFGIGQFAAPNAPTACLPSFKTLLPAFGA